MMNHATAGRIARFGRGATILRANHNALDDAQIINAAPSVFATGAHASRSERYTYIPTADVLRGLRAEGFLPFEVRQGGSRDEVKRGFTKHLMRLRRADAVMFGDSLPEVVLLNAHDGTSSYQMFHGIFRTLCSNGLIAGDFDVIRIPHKGNIVGQVIDAAYSVIDNSKTLEGTIGEMRQIDLRPAEQEAFAEAATMLRFDEESVPAVSPRQINAPHRTADAGNDLWRTFNRVQENLVRGGVSYVHTNSDGIRSHRSTRPVQSIDGDVKLNRALFTLAAKMAELKSA
jgi:Domain of unknown function (DUF932)